MNIINRYKKYGRYGLHYTILSICAVLLFSQQVHSQWVESDSLISISQLKSVFQNSGQPDSTDGKIVIGGIANTASGLLHETYLQTYLQNDTSGISIFSYTIDEPIATGDSVVVIGSQQIYFGQPELMVSDYKVYPKQNRDLKKADLFSAFNNPEKFTGMLVHGSGIIKEKGNRFNGKYLIIAPSDTASQTVMVYVSNFHGLYQDFDFDTPRVGDAISVTGVLGQYDPAFPEAMTYKVFLRTPDDFSYVGWPRYYFKILGIIMIALIIAGIGWTFLLRRQVKRKTEALEKSLAEKKILLQEIHHRVKNNLAAISGILELQSGTSDSEEVQQALCESQTRIKSMVMVHEKLYQSVSLKKIKMKTYLKELAEGISYTFTTNSSAVDIQIEASDDLELETEKVIPLGLLINELLVNAFKHAFSNQDEGIIWIKITQKGEVITLKVEDNGVGLPAGFNPDDCDSLGMILIKVFSEQLHAKKTMQNTPGACFVFEFPATLD